MSAHGTDRPLRTGPLLLAGGLSIANLFLHLPISDVLDAIYAKVGRAQYEVIGIVGIASLSVLAALPALRRFGTALTTTRLPWSLAGLLLLTLASQRWLLVTNIELIHFPQFALVSVLFLAAGVRPRMAWILGSLAGLLDETYQHLVLYAEVPDTYFDINDIFINSIGAAWGACLFGADRLAGEGAKIERSTALWMCGFLLAALFAAVLADPPDPTLLRPAMTRRMYRVLSTGEGLLGIALVAALVELASHPRPGKRT